MQKKKLAIYALAWISCIHVSCDLHRHIPAAVVIPRVYEVAPFGLPLRGAQPAFVESNFIAEQKDKLQEYLSDILQRCRCGFKGIWDNWGKVRAIGSRKKMGGPVSLPDFLLLQKDRQDTGRLLRMIGLYAVIPSMLPYYLLFVPGSLPSTFDLPKDRARRLISMTNQRISGVLHALMELEKACMNEKDPKAAEHAIVVKGQSAAALCADSWKSAVTVASGAIARMKPNPPKPSGDDKPKIDLGGMPDPFVKGMHIATGGSFSFLPGFILKMQIKGHLHKVYEFDQHVASLGVGALSSLGKEDLMDVCMERCLGDPTWSYEELHEGMRTWYHRLDDLNRTLVAGKPEMLACPFRSRLALMGVNAVSSVRAVSITGDLTRKLYAASQRPKLAY